MRLKFIILLFTISSLSPAFAQHKSLFSSGPAGEVVNAIFIDKEGTKWFGTDQGLSLYDGISWTNFGTGFLLPDPRVNDIWLDESFVPVSAWIATSGGLVNAEYSGGLFSNILTLKQTDGLLGNEILSLSRDILGTRFVALSDGVNYSGNSLWSAIVYSAFPTNLPNAPVRKVFSHKDSLYVATSGGIGRFVNKVDGISGASRWTSEYGISPLSGDITAIFVDSRGYQWFGTSAGLEKHEGHLAKEGWSLYTISEGLVNNYVLDICESPTGEIWVGTKGGISVFNNTLFQSFQKNDGLICDTIYDIAFDNDGSAWIATHRGVSHYHSGIFENYVAGLEKQLGRIPFKILYLAGSDKVDFEIDLDKTQRVSLSVYSISGRLVTVINDKTLPAGKTTLSWLLASGTSLNPNGIYIIKFHSTESSVSMKLILTR